MMHEDPVKKMVQFGEVIVVGGEASQKKAVHSRLEMLIVQRRLLQGIPAEIHEAVNVELPWSRVIQVVCVVESKLSLNKFESIRCKLSFYGCFVIGSSPKSGGILEEGS